MRPKGLGFGRDSLMSFSLSSTTYLLLQWYVPSFFYHAFESCIKSVCVIFLSFFYTLTLAWCVQVQRTMFFGGVSHVTRCLCTEFTDQFHCRPAYLLSSRTYTAISLPFPPVYFLLQYIIYIYYISTLILYILCISSSYTYMYRVFTFFRVSCTYLLYITIQITFFLVCCKIVGTGNFVRNGHELPNMCY